jgi:hypothetical protein
MEANSGGSGILGRRLSLESSLTCAPERLLNISEPGIRIMSETAPPRKKYRELSSRFISDRPDLDNPSDFGEPCTVSSHSHVRISTRRNSGEVPAILLSRQTAFDGLETSGAERHNGMTALRHASSVTRTGQKLVAPLRKNQRKQWRKASSQFQRSLFNAEIARTFHFASTTSNSILVIWATVWTYLRSCRRGGRNKRKAESWPPHSPRKGRGIGQRCGGIMSS